MADLLDQRPGSQLAETVKTDCGNVCQAPAENPVGTA